MNKPRTNPEQTFDLADLPNQDQAAFNKAIDHDFGGAISDVGDGFSRRRWLQLMGASLALGGAVGCRYEEEKIATFAFRPQNRIPGIPQRYATFTELGGVAEPLMSTNYDGRPIKLDGNPNHDESKGASTAFSQALMLEFYDPDRLRSSLKGTGETFEEVSFEDFIAECKFGTDLSSTAILAQPTSSPSLLSLKDKFVKAAGADNWFTFAAINDDNSRAGAKLAFGENLRTHHDLNTNVIVSIDADPIGLAAGSVANAISFAKGRDADSGKMSRLYAVESQYSTTGSAADHRLSVASKDIGGFVGSLLAAVTGDATAPAKDQPYRNRVFNAMVADLNANQGKSVVICGENQPAEVHWIVHRINEALGNLGKTVTFTKPADADRPSSIEAISSLAEKLKGGEIKNIVVLGGNPVYDAPRGLDIGSLLEAAEQAIHVSCYKNETSLKCDWVAAAAHPLAAWKDGKTFAGSTLVGQPLINPLHGGKSTLETLAALMGEQETSGQAIVRETLGLGDKEWIQAVHDGFVAKSQSEPVDAKLQGKVEFAAEDAWANAWDGETFELVFKTSNSVYDGRFANNAWLQELPDFFTKITWDNVASISPKTAEALGVTQSGMGAKSRTQKININIGGEPVEIPVAIQPGQADGSIGLEIGYGRTAAGRVAGDNTGVDSVGHDVSDLRTVDNWLVSPIKRDAIHSTGSTYQLAIVQEPWAIDEVARTEIQARMFRNSEGNRSGLIREGSFESYKEFRDGHADLYKDDHAAVAPKADGQVNNAMYATGAAGALPIMNQVSMTLPIEDKDHGDHDHSAGEDHGDHDHGHGHHAKWPEAFHMHHTLFDLTEGVREEYKQENPAYTNMWGKSIDLNKCIGCNSCVVACQSENNIPVVGKAEVWRGRELHWIRIDRYYGENLYTDDAEGDYQIAQQPVACHHCENAPCETVCPVAATVHSNEGLNDMVYNRCIGTRYCGNNCPYKVRRFNYLNYSDAVTFIKYPGADKLDPADAQLQNLMMNPEVSIRSRGVMEKCTYCVQRIQNTKIQAKNEGRRAIGANEITTACQDACPTSAIKFGDLNNLESDVRKAHDNPRAYSMLEDLNNRPRTKYLARVRNPHPSLIDFDDRDSLHGHGGEAHDDHSKEGHKAEDHKEPAGEGHEGEDHKNEDH